MFKQKYLADLVLLLVTVVWGTTFVVVQNAIRFLPPNTFNGIRFLIASIFLLGIILIFFPYELKNISKNTLKAGGIIGFFLFVGYALQTIGLVYTTPTKSAFITGLSVVLVPIFAFTILKIKPNINAIIGVSISAIGLYFLTIGDSFIPNIGDLLTLGCAISFAFQIVFVSNYANKFSAIILAWLQITLVALLSLVFAYLFEQVNLNTLSNALMAKEFLFSLLITSIFATAIAFIVQVKFQAYTSPTHVAIIFATEPVFGALTSYLVNGELLSLQGWLGSGLILLGVLITELPISLLFYKEKILFNRKER